MGYDGSQAIADFVEQGAADRKSSLEKLEQEKAGAQSGLKHTGTTQSLGPMTPATIQAIRSVDSHYANTHEGNGKAREIKEVTSYGCSVTTSDMAPTLPGATLHCDENLEPLAE